MRGRRWNVRGGGGRFVTTLERRFGLAVEVCETCRRLTPHEVGAPKPTHCQACGAEFKKEIA